METLRIEPDDQKRLSEIVKDAEKENASIVPWGSGAQQKCGSPLSECHRIVLSGKLKRILEYSEKDLVISVEAGITLKELQEFLRARGQFFPFWSPESGKRTLGGILASGEYNFYSQRFGFTRDLVLGLSVCGANGIITKSGGKVVKNVSGYEMPKLYIGSFGTLAYLLSCTLRLQTLPQKALFLIADSREPVAGFKVLNRLFRSNLLLTGAFFCKKKEVWSFVSVVAEKERLAIDQKEKLEKILTENCFSNIREISEESAETILSMKECDILAGGFFPPANLEQLYNHLEHFARDLKMESDLLFSLQGRFQAGWRENFAEDREQASSEKFSRLSRFVAENGGWIRYEKFPDERDWPMWGEERPEWKISLRLKKLLDPKDIFNRGRFHLRS